VQDFNPAFENNQVIYTMFYTLQITWKTTQKNKQPSFIQSK